MPLGETFSYYLILHRLVTQPHHDQVPSLPITLTNPLYHHQAYMSDYVGDWSIWFSVFQFHIRTQMTVRTVNKI